MRVRILTDAERAGPGGPAGDLASGFAVRAGAAVPGMPPLHPAADSHPSGSADSGGPDAALPAGYGGWRPRAVLGAPAPGGLALPAAQPTASWLYAPRGVYVGADLLVAADTGNHRVLIWRGLPSADGTPADVVLGQPDATSEGPQAGGRGPRNGMNLPTGVLVTAAGELVVADAWNHRILVWQRLPTATDTPPDVVLGQPDATGIAPNAGDDAIARGDTFYWPFGIGMVDGAFVVADTGNRRVLLWRDGLPAPGQPADVVLGQSDPHAREENRGGPVGPASFRWPHAVGSDGRGGLLVTDAGNHRVLCWSTLPTQDRPADAVLGQPDLTSGDEFPYVPQVGRLRFPYGLATGAGQQGPLVALADTANNRVLLWDALAAPAGPVIGAPADAVLGQPDPAANGENRWSSVVADSLCWPYGLGLHRGPAGDVLAVADSGNNRVVLWERPT